MYSTTWETQVSARVIRSNPVCMRLPMLIITMSCSPINLTSQCHFTVSVVCDCRVNSCGLPTQRGGRPGSRPQKADQAPLESASRAGTHTSTGLAEVNHQPLASSPAPNGASTPRIQQSADAQGWFCARCAACTGEPNLVYRHTGDVLLLFQAAGIVLCIFNLPGNAPKQCSDSGYDFCLVQVAQNMHSARLTGATSTEDNPALRNIVNMLDVYTKVCWSACCTCCQR